MSDEKFYETSIGKIPESWQIKTIGEIAEVKGRIGWRGYRLSDLVEDGPWVIGRKEINTGWINFNTAKHLTKEKYDESPEIMLKDKDIIIAKTGTIGPVALYYDEYGDTTINPNVRIIRSKSISPILLLRFLKSSRAQHYLKEYTTSSVQPAINQATIKKLEIPLPKNKVILELIENQLNKINELQYYLSKEIVFLERLRDTLLPKLMSGEIDVSEIKING